MGTKYSASQHASATSLLEVVLSGIGQSQSADNIFALYQRCLETVTGEQKASKSITFKLTCSECGATTDVVAPYPEPG